MRSVQGLRFILGFRVDPHDHGIFGQLLLLRRVEVLVVIVVVPVKWLALW